ncbi:MAG: hypothetical protein SFV15_25340 [Polyangiaceae bacterium]|nr:hypothetical protein [Polyangiaceae bacterium]
MIEVISRDAKWRYLILATVFFVVVHVFIWTLLRDRLVEAVGLAGFSLLSTAGIVGVCAAYRVRPARAFGTDWGRYAQQTANVPLLAISPLPG